MYLILVKRGKEQFETFNGWNLHIRTKPIITMLHKIAIIVMNKICLKKGFSNKWGSELAPRIVKLLKKNIEKSF